MKKYFIIGLLGLTLVLPACAKAQTTNTEDIMASLRQQITNLLQQIDKMQEELGRLRGEVVKVEEQIEKLTKYLQIGIKDKEVTILQEFLKQDPEVYPEGLVTGYYGPLTEKAVKKFQEKNGIESVGVVGPKTLAKINEVIEEKKISKPITTSSVCVQVITPAKDPKTGKCKEFSTPCDVPAGWEKTDKCVSTLTQTPNPSLFLAAPNNGETWQIGKTYNILWKSANLPADAKIGIRLNLHGGTVQIIPSELSNLVNDGIESWTVPATTPIGKYTVDVFSSFTKDGNSYYLVDASDNPIIIEAATFSLSPVAPFINVLSPNGGEVWAKGSTRILQWKSSSDINSVYIKLRKGTDTYPGSEGVVTPGVSYTGTSSGSHPWTIPTTLPDGNDYAIRIIDKTGAVLDDSDAPFSIVTTVPQNQAPIITGGPTSAPGGLMAGQTVNFSWNAEDGNKDNLVWSVNWGDGESMLTACPSSNPSAGQGWTLNIFHKWQQAGTYTAKITVSDCKGGTYSQSLTVNVSTAVAPYITIISPNGGETWYMGKTYDILWKSSGVEKVYIAAEVFKDGVSVGSLGIAGSADNVSAALGKYSWTPNSNHLREGNQFKILVSNTETPASGVSTPETLPSDESDNYFKIVDSEVSVSEGTLDQMANVLNSIKSMLEKMLKSL